jgi:predicted phage terminase large subunit-like protein
MTVLDILNNPNLTFGIFSHTRKLSKKILNNLKVEFEQNQLLKDLFPNIFYASPQKEAIKWSEDDGICVKRTVNRREATIEAHGLVDSMPTGVHFDVMVFDDVVSDTSVGTDDQIKKTTDAWRLALNLGSDGGKYRYIGTRYHIFDTYAAIKASGVAQERVYPCYDAEGNPVLYSEEYINLKRMAAVENPGIFSAQMLCNPMADIIDGFDLNWLRYYKNNPLDERSDKNVYVLADPAHSRKKDSDFTVFAVVGLGPDGRYYLLDAVRDRLNLSDRTDALFDLVKTWRPIHVGYERYGKDSDIEHIEYMMETYRHRFEIVELGGGVKKEERIRRLIPVMKDGRFYVPQELVVIDRLKQRRDLLQELVQDEMSHFPLSKHDDMLDCISRVLDPKLGAIFPNAGALLNKMRRNTEDSYMQAMREAQTEGSMTWMGV